MPAAALAAAALAAARTASPRGLEALRRTCTRSLPGGSAGAQRQQRQHSSAAPRMAPPAAAAAAGGAAGGAAAAAAAAAVGAKRAMRAELKAALRGVADMDAQSAPPRCAPPPPPPRGLPTPRGRTGLTAPPRGAAAAGAAVCAAVAASPAFRQARSVGLYVTCARLREVDTSALLRAALEQGAHASAGGRARPAAAALAPAAAAECSLRGPRAPGAAAGKQVFVPLVEEGQSCMRLLHIDTLNDLQPAPPFGILEPPRTRPDGTPREHALEAPFGLDLLLMPGLGFDAAGRRLGRGGGYYDKLVHDLEARARRHGWQAPWLVALAFEQQVVAEVPTSDHDRRIDVLATRGALLRCSERAQQQLP
ncbi:5FCL [Scenedesmus sp. PABB004]|nr:5FCL [Scenedesmus sp. PABB004]